MKEVIFLLTIFILIIGVAYFLTKKLASLSTFRMQGKNMKILETIQIGINQYIHLIQVGDKIFIIGLSKETISYLDQINEESIDLSLYKVKDKPPSFEQYLKKWIEKRKDGQ